VNRSTTLAELRRIARSLGTESERLRLAEDLGRDPRLSVRALAGQLLRAVHAQQRERERLARLFERTRALERAGARAVAGVDEVGVGPLAGPLVAAAVILGRDSDLPGLDDSKQLSPAQREALATRIRAQSLAVGISEIPPAEVDELNVYCAGLEAMRRAVLALDPAPDFVLVDARTIPGISMRQTAIVGGDALEAPIAAASIIAKVHRDAIMRAAHTRHPEYGFDRHMGYATAQHLAALRRFGPTALHRRSTAPVAEAQLAVGAGA
jgi:ribonuclease HII